MRALVSTTFTHARSASSLRTRRPAPVALGSLVTRRAACQQRHASALLTTSGPAYHPRCATAICPLGLTARCQRWHSTRVDRAGSPLHDLKSVSTATPTLTFASTTTNPYYNLSLEHYLLTQSSHDSQILFLYTNRPCVVIGRNQNPWAECNLQEVLRGLPQPAGETSATSTKERVQVDLVRRRSGGGTVVHGPGNLNYCAIVPNDKSFNRRTHAEMVVRALQSLQSSDAFMRKYPGFGGREIKVNERHDIVMRPTEKDGWLKVSGSAFKLTRGRALHHGTLLLASPHLSNIAPLLRSPAEKAITKLGVGSVRSPVGNLYPSPLTAAPRDALSQEVQRAIAAEFNAHITHGGGGGSGVDNADPISLSARDCEEAINPDIARGVRELQSHEWKALQTPRFSFAATSSRVRERTLHLDVVRGVIESLTVTTGSGKKSAQVTPRPPSSVGQDSPSPSSRYQVHDVGGAQEWRATLRRFADEHHDGGGISSKAGSSAAAELLETGVNVDVDVDDSVLAQLEQCFPRWADVESWI